MPFGQPNFSQSLVPIQPQPTQPNVYVDPYSGQSYAVPSSPYQPPQQHPQPAPQQPTPTGIQISSCSSYYFYIIFAFFE
jgi:hypothetical protein